eukprot:CAMPEP_0172554054 /NCGR_PEP_ID=MMETSP1067-20121228/52992_1 /TAXON_ID=265564 ORGANISM="Thalassiosira punctigera, Strain Tpunct2005C2" /NCGR_SAMPLE_ID=MMETSP1067 /ASSEMBLY_ACC=CAM_ASM_000444 /LENGTH=61 /DNA_ID=CAMNT_0013342357 /DNA_START=50 /DNA_END=232 /DNA_ORIENTATION=-
MVSSSTLLLLSTCLAATPWSAPRAALAFQTPAPSAGGVASSQSKHRSQRPESSLWDRRDPH